MKIVNIYNLEDIRVVQKYSRFKGHKLRPLTLALSKNSYLYSDFTNIEISTADQFRDA